MTTIFVIKFPKLIITLLIFAKSIQFPIQILLSCWFNRFILIDILDFYMLDRTPDFLPNHIIIP